MNDGVSVVASTQGRLIGGRYALRSPMGSNGVGTVWRAYDHRRDHDVAIQEVVMPPGASAAERHMLCQRSMREARTVATLRHPSVAPICDVIMHGDRPWIVMEFLTSRSLHEVVRDDGPLPYAVVADTALHVLGALEAAHEAGILHRDVKPSNILLGRGSWAALTGFGVARTSGESAMTSAGLALCSPSYIPPERARGDEASAASDLWSLGAALFTAVEGHPPFDAGDPMPTLAAILADDPVQFQRAGPLAPVLAGLLEKDPRRRWDLERARAGLRAVLAGTDPSAPMSPRLSRLSPTTPSSTWSRPARPLRQPTVQSRQSSSSSLPAAPRARSPAGGAKPYQSHRSTSSPSGRRLAITVAAGACACILVAVLLVVTISRLGPGSEPAPPPASPATETSSTPAPTATPTPEAKLSPSASAAGASDSRPAVPVPAAYARYDSALGFSLDVPVGWSKKELSNGDTMFREPTRGRIIGLQRVDKAAKSMREYWRDANSAQHGQPGYQFLGISTVKMAGKTGADWKFKRRQGTGSAAITHRTVGRGILVDNTAYIVYLSTRDPDFAASQAILDRVAGSLKLSR